MPMPAAEFDSPRDYANDCRPIAVQQTRVMQRIEVIHAGWSAPGNVCAISTTRGAGVSVGPYRSLNLGDHVGDDAGAVAANRERVARALSLPAAPRWLTQVHGSTVVDAGRAGVGCEADAAWTDRSGVVCAVLTADCVPLALATRCGRRVAAVHVGWRGLAAGVVENAVATLADDAGQLVGWMGPAISQRAFEVGPEVRSALAGDDEALAFFAPGRADRYMADLFGLLRLRLARLGVGEVAGGEHCTYSDPGRFFSYRRDGRCGRMATLVWRAAEAG